MKRNPLHCGTHWLALACIAMLMGIPGSARSATFGELYTVSVEVDPSASNQRSDAIRRAMSVLLTRITGRQQAAAYPGMQALIDDAEDYLFEYAPLSGNETRVGFIRSAVNQALSARNMPIWGDERPLTLLWVATDFGNGYRAELKASGDAGGLRPGAARGEPSNELPFEESTFFNDIAAELLRAADERGLPIVLPQLDETDRRQVRFADVWGGFDRPVALAAERYRVDAVLIARVRQTDFGPQVDWIVRRGDRREILSTPRARMGIDWLADEFASTYTTTGGLRPTWITIREIRNRRDFSRVRQYVESVSIIESVFVESLTGSDLLLRVATRGDDSRLRGVFALDGELVAEQNDAGLVFIPSWIDQTQFFDEQ